MMFAVFGISILGIYISFLVFGALAGSFVSGAAPRAVLALLFAFLFPMVTAFSLLDNESRHAVRWTKMSLSVFAVSVGSALLVCLFVPNQLIGNLYENPNWFLGREASIHQGFARANADLSTQIANVAEEVAHKAGTYTRTERTGHRVIAP